MLAYSVKLKKKVEITPKSIKQNPNGTYSVIGVDKDNNKVAKIVSKNDAEKIKQTLK
jgi:hypothetical protein